MDEQQQQRRPRRARPFKPVEDLRSVHIRVKIALDATYRMYLADPNAYHTPFRYARVAYDATWNTSRGQGIFLPEKLVRMFNEAEGSTQKFARMIEEAL